jgi:group I intron endonuclease
MMGVVYLLVNRINKKAYVGMTIQRLGARLSYHLTGKNSYFLLSKALRKYGPENFDVAVIESCSDIEILKARELFWTDKLGCLHPVGYNMARGGGGTPGLKRSEQWKRSMAEKRKGSNNPNYGNHAPWSAARRAADRHRPMPPHVKQALREGAIRNAIWTKRLRRTDGTFA